MAEAAVAAGAEAATAAGCGAVRAAADIVCCEEDLDRGDDTRGVVGSHEMVAS